MITWHWRLKFEPRDLWIGVYWNRALVPYQQWDVDYVAIADFDVYVCLLPCCLIHFKRRIWEHYG